MARIRFAMVDGAPAFFHPALDYPGGVPETAVEISAERHRALLHAQGLGATITLGADGFPRADLPRRTLARRREEALQLVRAAAGRRIREVASIERQSNDNALIATAAMQIAAGGSTTIDTTPALARRARIDRLRDRSNALEAQVMGMNATALAAFDPFADQHWN